MAVLAAAFSAAAVALSAAVGVAARAETARLDAYGDPLPEGAIARIGTTRLRLVEGMGTARCATFQLSNDGGLLLSQAPHARLFEVPSGKLLRSFPGGVASLSPDGARCATDVGIYRTDTGQPVLEWRKAPGDKHCKVWNVAWVPGGETVATIENTAAGEPQRLRLRSDRTGLVLEDVPSVHPGRLNTILRVGPAGSGVLATLDAKRLLWLFDAVTLTPLRPLSEFAQDVAFSADGAWVAMPRERMIVSVSTGAVVRPSSFEVGYMASGPEGLWVSSGGWRRGFALLDPSSGRERRFLSLGRDRESVVGLSVSGDGRRLAWAASDGMIRILDAASGTEVTPSVRLCSRAVGLGWSPDGRRVYTRERYGRVRSWDASTGAPVTTVAEASEGMAVVVRPSDGAIAVSGEGDLALLDAATGRVLTRTARERDELPLTFTPDGRRLITWDFKAAHVRDGAALGLERTIPMASEGRAPRLTPDGARLSLALKESVVLIDVATGKVSGGIPIPPPEKADRFVPQGIWDALLVAGEGGATVVRFGEIEGFSFPKGRPPERTFQRSRGSGSDRYVPSPDGARVARIASSGGVTIDSSPPGGSITLHSSPDGRVLGVLRDPSQSPWSADPAAAFSPDGGRIAVTGDEGEVLIWDVSGMR